MKKKRISRNIGATEDTSSSTSTRRSVAELNAIVDKLRIQRHRSTTFEQYYGIWQNFNKFVITLDVMPRTWEERTSLYAGFLVSECSVQSSTLKSYISAIKAMLQLDNYSWDDEECLLSTLIQTCRLTNDTVRTRLPIKKPLLGLILDQVKQIYEKEKQQIYLSNLYRTAFVLGYYGLFRVSEITQTKSGHAVKAIDVHSAQNCQKLLFILHSSKTHGRNSKPQEIKIEALPHACSDKRHHCPFIIINSYMRLRGGFVNEMENFLVFRDHSPLRAPEFRRVLKLCLSRLGLDSKLYDTHSFRGGRATDMLKMNYTVEEIKKLGRWRSNAVYKYLQHC